MACSIRQNTIDILEREGFIESKNGELIRKKSPVDIMAESTRMSLIFNKNYGTTDIPFMNYLDQVVMNENLFAEIDTHLAERGVDVVSPEYIEESRNEAIASMRAVMRKLGIQEKLVTDIRDREGNKLDIIASANILDKTISYLEGKDSELPEEVIHFMVVALKELNDPLYTSMRDRIFKEPEYNEVMGDPKLKSLNYTAEDYIDEAITKVVLNRFLSKVAEETPTKEQERNDRWWNRALRKLKSFFDMSDPFNKTVREMFKEDLTRYADAISESTRETIFASTGEPVMNQEMIRNSLIAQQASIKKDTPFKKDLFSGKIDDASLEVLENEDGLIVRYSIDGKPVTRRATDKSSIAFMRSVGGIEKYKRITSKKRSALLRETGTTLHGIAEELMIHIAKSDKFKKHFNIVDMPGSKAPRPIAQLKKESGFTKPEHFKEMERAVTEILEGVIEDSSKEKGEKIDLFTEIIVYSARLDTAGTIDMLFVMPDGTAQVFDYKFVSPLAQDVRKVGDKVFMSLDPFRGAKIQGYEDQMSFYLEALRMEYGISDVTKSRLVPGHVRFSYDGNKATGINYFSMGFDGDRFVAQYPLGKEMTDVDAINDDLKVLYKKLDALKKKKTTPGIRREQALIITAVKDLLNKSDMAFTLSEIKYLIDYSKELLKKSKKDDNDYPSFEDVRSVYELLGTFETLNVTAQRNIEKLTKKDKTKGNKLKDDLENAAGEVRKASMALKSELKTRLMKTSKFNSGTTPFYDLDSIETGFLNQMLSMGEVENVLFKDGFDRIVEAHSRADADYRLHYQKWAKLEAGLKEWGNSRDAYNMIIRETDNGLKLITMFDPKFREERNSLLNKMQGNESKKEKSAGVKQMKEWYQIKEGAKKEFQEFRKKYLADKEKEFAGKDNYKYKAAEKYFSNTYDVFNNPNAWVSPRYYKFLELKPEVAAANYSKEYSELLKPENKAVLTYYDAWKEQMKEFDSLAEGKSLAADMIPSMHKGVVEGIVTGENILESIGKNMLQGVTIDVENEENVGQDAAKSIPLPYVAPPRDSKGDVNTVLVSRDLTKVMVKFGASFFEFVENSRAESELLFIRDLLHESEEVQKKGVRELQRESGKLVTDKVSEGTKKLYDTYLNMLLYKNFERNMAGSAQIFGRQVSGAKVMRQMMSAFSKSTLTLPVKAALATTAASTIFRIAKGIDNPNYSYEVLKQSAELFAKDNSRYMGIAGYFDVHSDGDRVFHERELTGDPFTRYTDTDYMYYPLIPADRINDRRLLVAMLFNHAVDENGMIQRLEDMPEGTKPLAETMEVEDGKVTKELDQSVRNQIKMRFLGEVRGIRGDMSNLGIAAYQDNLVLSMIMQFKSWMPAMVRDRFGSKVKYDIYTGKYETGRYLTTIRGAIMSKEDVAEDLAWTTLAVNAASSLKGLLTTLVGLDDYALSEKTREKKIIEGKWNKEGPQEERYQRRRKKYESEYRFIKENAVDPMIKNMPIEKFYQLQQMAVRSTIAEVRAVLALMLLSMAMGWKGDDDKEWYKETWASRRAHDLLARTLLETAMFINPAELANLNRSVVPVLGLLENFIKLGYNMADESADLLTGDMFEKGDYAQPFHYTLKFVPGANNIKWMLGLNR